MWTLTIRREIFPIMFRNFLLTFGEEHRYCLNRGGGRTARLAQDAESRLLSGPQATLLMHVDRSRKGREELNQSDYGLRLFSAAPLIVAEQRYRMRFAAEFVA